MTPTEERKKNTNMMIQLLSNQSINSIQNLEYMDEPLFKRLILDSPSFVTTRGEDDEAQRMTKLSPDCTPGSFDVICARGGKAKTHKGKIHFCQKIKESADAYAKAESKLFKSLVVSKVIKGIQKASPEGDFVKPINGVWYQVGDLNKRFETKTIVIINQVPS
jgi:hypothetical protein